MTLLGLDLPTWLMMGAGLWLARKPLLSALPLAKSGVAKLFSFLKKTPAPAEPATELDLHIERLRACHQLCELLPPEVATQVHTLVIATLDHGGGDETK